KWRCDCVAVLRRIRHLSAAHPTAPTSAHQRHQSVGELYHRAGEHALPAMQATGSSLMRRLSSAIHPQLPLDARRTEQLLATLTASFQRHLDRAHPTSSTIWKGQNSTVTSGQND